MFLWRMWCCGRFNLGFGRGVDVLEGAALLPFAGTVLSFAFCVKYWVR